MIRRLACSTSVCADGGRLNRQVGHELEPDTDQKKQKERDDGSFSRLSAPADGRASYLRIAPNRAPQPISSLTDSS
jgi:hypothetical protein